MGSNYDGKTVFMRYRQVKPWRQKNASAVKSEPDKWKPSKFTRIFLCITILVQLPKGFQKQTDAMWISLPNTFHHNSLLLGNVAQFLQQQRCRQMQRDSAKLSRDHICFGKLKNAIVCRHNFGVPRYKINRWKTQMIILKNQFRTQAVAAHFL